MIVSLKVSKYFLVAKSGFFYLLGCGNKVLNQKNLCFFSRKSQPVNPHDIKV